MKPWHNFGTIDVVAILLIGVATVNLFTLRDPTLTGTLTLIAGYYFGKKASTLPPGSGPAAGM